MTIFFSVPGVGSLLAFPNWQAAHFGKQVIFAAAFGYGQDRELLEFADHEAIQEAPQVSFA